MVGIVEGIRQKLDEACFATGDLEKQGCGLDISNVPEPRLVIDLDEAGSPLGRSSTRCDYVLVAEETATRAWVIPVEMKSGKLKVSRVVEQLQAGCKVGERLVHRKCVSKFLPVAVMDGPLGRAQWKQLKNPDNFVTLYGHREVVRVILCGRALDAVVGA